MIHELVTVSGLPASGKSTLARQLAVPLALPVIDKDDILERLFNSMGIGDATWRRSLSRESDVLLEAAVHAAERAIVVSFWHVDGMPSGSGTPTAWLREADRHVNLHCACPPEIAARRFAGRQRHPGHDDGRRSPAELLDEFRTLHALGRPAFTRQLDVDTAAEPAIDELARRVRELLHPH